MRRAIPIVLVAALSYLGAQAAFQAKVDLQRRNLDPATSRTINPTPGATDVSNHADRVLEYRSKPPFYGVLNDISFQSSPQSAEGQDMLNARMSPKCTASNAREAFPAEIVASRLNITATVVPSWVTSVVLTASACENEVVAVALALSGSRGSINALARLGEPIVTNPPPLDAVTLTVSNGLPGIVQVGPTLIDDAFIYLRESEFWWSLTCAQADLAECSLVADGLRILPPNRPLPLGARSPADGITFGLFVGVINGITFYDPSDETSADIIMRRSPDCRTSALARTDPADAKASPLDFTPAYLPENAGLWLVAVRSCGSTVVSIQKDYAGGLIRIERILGPALNPATTGQDHLQPATIASKPSVIHRVLGAAGPHIRAIFLTDSLSGWRITCSKYSSDECLRVAEGLNSGAPDAE